MKIIRVTPFLIQDNKTRRLIFREKQRDDLFSAIWNFVTVNSLMNKPDFISFEASVASSIAAAILTYNQEYADTFIKQYANYMEECGHHEALKKYNDLKTNWSKLTRVVIDQLRVVRNSHLSMSDPEQDDLELEEYLKSHFLLVDLGVIHSFCEQLQLSGVDVTKYQGKA